MSLNSAYEVPRVYQVEGTSGRITGTITNDAGTAILPDTLTLLLYDLKTGTIINSRNRQNVLNLNGVTISGAGGFEWRVSAADNVVVASPNQLERHRALFEWTFAGGQGKAEIDVLVANLSRVPTN
jgi:hypothetical protein